MQNGQNVSNIQPYTVAGNQSLKMANYWTFQEEETPEEKQ